MDFAAFKQQLARFGPNQSYIAGLVRLEEVTDFDQAHLNLRHDLFQVVMITSGMADLQLEHQPYALTANNLAFSYPNWNQSWTIHEPLKGYILLLNAEFYIAEDDYVAEMNLSPGVDHVIDFQRYSDRMILIFEQFMHEYQELPEMAEMTFLLWKRLLAAYANRETVAKAHRSATREHQIYLQYLEVCVRNLYHRVRVADMAQQMQLNERRLNHICQMIAGKTARRVFAEFRMKQAEKLLRLSEHPIQEIAKMLHFADAAHFSRAFKAHSGLAPLEYRAYGPEGEDGSVRQLGDPMLEFQDL
jgi:AraC family transcriptional activator of pobA